jgi:hypothetical protein
MAKGRAAVCGLFREKPYNHLTILVFKLQGGCGIIRAMKTWFDPASAFMMPFFATLAMRPPLVPVQVLIGVVLGCCIVLFLTRSRAELKQQMYDRLYGPGAKTASRDWWEADLDPIFMRSVTELVNKWVKR